MKPAQHPGAFGQTLLETGDLQIVEYFTRDGQDVRDEQDSFWGTKSMGDMLVGSNVKGKILTALREELKQTPDDPSGTGWRFFKRFSERPLEPLVIDGKTVPPPKADAEDGW